MEEQPWAWLLIGSLMLTVPCCGSGLARKQEKSKDKNRNTIFFMEQDSGSREIHLGSSRVDPLPPNVRSGRLGHRRWVSRCWRVASETQAVAPV